ncbi:MAG: DUF2231 domain-containing protein [Candidatus Krumholzibacteriia bacterium]
MLGLPPLPGWDGLHPLIVHFPIALLFVAPVFLAAALARPAWRRAALASALVLATLGTAALYIAVPTGKAAGQLAERTPEINAALERHESLAETTRTLFTILTVILAVMLLAPRLLGRDLAPAPARLLQAAFLALYLGGTLVLANAAHEGGRLVHEFGVHALVASADPED